MNIRDELEDKDGNLPAYYVAVGFHDIATEALANLENYVVEMIRLGYSPVGGVLILDETDSNTYRYTAMQAMVLVPQAGAGG